MTLELDSERSPGNRKAFEEWKMEYKRRKERKCISVLGLRRTLENV